MKAPVVFNERLHLALAGQPFPFGHNVLKKGAIVALMDMFSRQSGRLAFQCFANLEQVHDFIRRQPAHHSTPVRYQFDQTIRCQPAKSLAQRPATDPQFVGKVFRDKTLAWRQSPFKNLLFQFVGYAFDRVACTHSGCWSGSGEHFVSSCIHR